MAIQYSGSTLINFTFTDANTRIDLVNKLNAQLKLAGWTALTGDGTADVLMESATTPQGFKIRFRLFDPGSGNCAQVSMKDASQTSSVAFLLPGTRNWRIIANKYQFFMFVQGAADPDRGTVMGGVPWAPSFVSGTYFGWMQNRGTSDTLSNGTTFRTQVSAGGGNSFTSSQLMNGTLTNTPAGTSAAQLTTMRSSNATAQCYRWEDGSPFIIEPMLCWPIGALTSGECRVKGELWDAVVVMLEYTGESLISFDGHTWLAITVNSSTEHATLFVAVI